MSLYYAHVHDWVACWWAFTHIGRTSSIGVVDLAVMWAGDVKREVVRHERHEEGRGVEIYFHPVNLNNRWRCVISFNLRPLYASRERRRNLLNMRRGGPQKQCPFWWRNQSPLRLPWLDPRLAWPLAAHSGSTHSEFILRAVLSLCGGMTDTVSLCVSNGFILLVSAS